MEARLKRCCRECDVSIERRIQFESPRLTREVPKPEQAPFGSALVRHRKLVAGDVEGRPVVTMAGVDHIFLGQQDGRVVKAPSFGGERTKYTPDMPGSNLAAENAIGWAVGDEKHVPSLLWLA